jgi:hypothetical protein
MDCPVTLRLVVVAIWSSEDHDARHECHQFQVVAAVQSQIRHLFGINGMGEFAGHRVDAFAEDFGYGHALAYSTYLQLEIRRDASAVG